LCIRPELAPHALEILDPDFIDRDSYRELFTDILERVENKGISDPAVIMEKLGDSEREMFSAAVAYTETSEDMRKTLEEKVALYKRAVINRKITAISSRLDGMGDVDKEKTDKLKAELVEAFGQLKDIKRI
jgi:hypothetical protein